eukprot:6047557-Pyramimonas_sp.AAC.1
MATAGGGREGVSVAVRGPGIHDDMRDLGHIHEEGILMRDELFQRVEALTTVLDRALERIVDFVIAVGLGVRIRGGEGVVEGDVSWRGPLGGP